MYATYITVASKSCAVGFNLYCTNCKKNPYLLVDSLIWMIKFAIRPPGLFKIAIIVKVVFNSKLGNFV